MRFYALTAPLLLSIALSIHASAEDNLVDNGDFSRVGTSQQPEGWRVVNDDPAAVIKSSEVDGVNQHLQVTIQTVSGSQGQVGQWVNTLQPNHTYRFSGWVRSELAGQAFFQIKLYEGKKELERISVGGAGPEWKRVEKEILTGDTVTRAEVLCRYKRNAKGNGTTVHFADIRLVDLGEKVIVPPTIQSLEAVSTFENVGLTLGFEGDASNDTRCTVQYRVQGDKSWHKAMDLHRIRSSATFRGSVLNLTPDTDYELRCELWDKQHNADKPLASREVTVRTWAENVPIGKTVYLPAGTTNEPVVITESGSPEAWLLVTHAPDAQSRIDVGNDSAAAVSLRDVSYVIVRNLTIRGGSKRGVDIRGAHHIRIERCDIAGWGEAGTADPSTKNGLYVDADGKRINLQAGVHVGPKSAQVAVTGNFIHSPRGTANSWQHGHPAGPQAVILDNPEGNLVVRHNEMIGSEDHWWNDAVESMYNKNVNGGPHRETDIYGNVMAFANDDGTELDGGQINVRFFNNRVQWAYCGVSCAPNREGPSYVYRNLFVLTGEQRGRTNFGFKMGGDRFSNPGRSLLFHNTMVSDGSGLKTGNFGKGATPVTTRNNVFLSGDLMLTGKIAGNYDLDHDLIQDGLVAPPETGQEANAVLGIPRFSAPEQGDYRLSSDSLGIDEGVHLPGINDDYSGQAPDLGAFEQGAAVDFPVRHDGMSALPQYAATLVTAGQTDAPGVVTVTLNVPSTLGQTWRAHPNADWIVCEPDAGPTGSDAQQVQVRINAAALEPSRRRAAVTFRTDEGHCRTVLIEAKVRHPRPFVHAVEAEAGELLNHFEVASDPKASGGRFLHMPEGWLGDDAQGGVAFTFEVPEDGTYYVNARTMIPGPIGMQNDSFFVAMDDEPIKRWNVLHVGSPLYHWVGVENAKAAYPRAYELTQGEHTFRVLPRESLARLDALQIANEPFVVAE